MRAGVDSLVSRIPVTVAVDVTAERVQPAIEATAYFIVAEALTNVAKHSGADSAQVRIWIEGGTLRVEVRDDGVGGASLERGSGMRGLLDRLATLGGTIRVASPAGAGTTLVAEVPLGAPPGACDD